MLAFWKGNGVQIIRIFPYSAGQLMTNDMYKRLLANHVSLGRQAVAAAQCLSLAEPAMRLAATRRCCPPVAGWRADGAAAADGGRVRWDDRDCADAPAGHHPPAAGAAQQRLHGCGRQRGGLGKGRAGRNVLPVWGLPRMVMEQGLCALPLAGMGNAFATVVRQEGPAALYKGLLPTLVGIAPYAALNFATYDLLKHTFYQGGYDK